MNTNDDQTRKDEIIRLCRKYNISYHSNLDILNMELDEFQAILALCINNDINLSSSFISSIIFKRDAVEIGRIIKICTDHQINFSKLGVTVFNMRSGELLEIINFCKDNGLSYVTEDGCFKDVSLADLTSAVRVCKDNGIDIHNTEIMFRMSGEELSEFLEICKSNNIKFEDAMGINLHDLKNIVSECKKRNIEITPDVLLTYPTFLYRNYGSVKSEIILFLEEFKRQRKEGFLNGETIERNYISSLSPAVSDKIQIQDVNKTNKSNRGNRFGKIIDGHLIINEGVEVINAAAFMNFRNITKITFPSTLKFIERRAFKNCTSLKSISLPEGVLEIEDEAFDGCWDLNSISLPESLIRIGAYAFQNTGLRKVEFSSGLREIGHSAFSNCGKLTTVKLNEGLEVVQTGAFYGCDISECLNIPESVRIFDSSFVRGSKLAYLSYGKWGISFRQAFGQDYNCGFESKAEFFSKLIQICSDMNVANFPLHYIGDNSVEIDLEDFCMNVFRTVIIQSDSESDKINAFQVYNHAAFAKNIMYLKEQFNIEDIDSITQLVLDSNYSLLSGSIVDGFKNFDYLVEQNIFSRELLVKLYFDGVDGDTTEELFHNYYLKHKTFPPLFRTLMVEGNDKNRVELRDRLVFVSTMKLVESEELLQGNYNKVRMYLSRDLWESTVDYDESLMFHVDKDVYKIVNEKYPCLKGIIYPIYSKLCSIDKEMAVEFLESLKRKGSKTDFMKFYNSLNTINNWNAISDRVDRATILKNEIFGKLLYADMSLALKDTSYRKSSAARRIYVERKKNGVRNAFDDVISLASKPNDELFTNSDLIGAMIMIDTYSFDALRTNPDLFVGRLGVNYVELAIKHGYLFSEEEVQRLKKLPRFNNQSDDFFAGTIKHYIEKIINVVGMPKVPKEDKKEFLSAIRNKIQLYVSTKSSDSLFDFCRTVDFYLRENNEYMLYGQESLAASKVVFDKNSDISNDARVLYCLYSLNQLAHHAVEMNSEATFKEHDRLSFGDDISKRRIAAFNAYNSLYRYGLDFDAVKSLLSTSDRLAKLDFSPENIPNIMPILNFWRNAELCPNLYSDNDVMSIGAQLKIINECSQEEIDLMEVEANEQSVFFECKRMLSQEVMRRISSTLSPELISAMGGDLAAKQSFYAKNGFVAEIQSTSNGPTLVCLCEQFNEPFSVHLKDLPNDLIERFGAIIDNPPPPTIAHCKLNRRGLTIRGADYASRLENDPSPIIATEFHDNVSFSEIITSVQKTNYINYDLPARHIRAGNLIDNNQATSGNDVPTNSDDVPTNGDETLGSGGSGKK